MSLRTVEDLGLRVEGVSTAAADDSTAALRVKDPGGGGALRGPGDDVGLWVQLEGGAEARSVARTSGDHLRPGTEGSGKGGVGAVARDPVGFRVQGVGFRVSGAGCRV